MTKTEIIKIADDLDYLECRVSYEYVSPEEATLEYPGCEAEIYINSITYNGMDITDNISDDCYDDIIEKLYEIEGE